MTADRPLWINEEGSLCDSPPSPGIKVAGVRGIEIPEYIVKKYGLEKVNGKVAQKLAEEPENKMATAPNKAFSYPPESKRRRGRPKLKK